ncbi:hypothetical protein F2Q69_00039463 [Brassica cretica]|uniref:Coenzyme Q-binding protein COQ10 START domain-containing protein n=1 Tax=Brassica cretica TaxID=69181 RepID=A0A8S9NTY2_BRACR|nr:hypothetical protein F2Q69_00039463 [Brassica cretica]
MVADDAKNSRALGDIGERKSKPNRLQRTSRLWFKDGCICEESPELIRTEREREEAKSHTAHTVKHSFHRHLLSFLTDDDAITNLLPSFRPSCLRFLPSIACMCSYHFYGFLCRLYSGLTILQGGSNCQVSFFKSLVVLTAELAIMASTNSVEGTVRFFPQGPSSCEVELTFAYEVPLLLVPFATVADDVKNSRALGNIGERKPNPNRLQWGTVRFFPQGPSSCEVELTFAYEVPLLLVPFATALQPLMQGMIKDSLELFAEIAKTTKTT